MSRSRVLATVTPAATARILDGAGGVALAAVRAVRALGSIGLLLVVTGCHGPWSDADCAAARTDRSVDTGPTRLGPVVSAGPDADGDGLPDLVVGLPGDPIDRTLGTVRLVSGATGAIVRTWSADVAGDQFGAAVALGPDADGDGLGDVLVGAPEHASGQGRVELYSGGSGALLRGWDGQPSAWLGEHVALGPDLDGDGRGDVAFTDALTYDEWVEGGDILHGKHGHVHVVSGASGAERRVLAATHDDETVALATLGPDADGDGAGDLLLTDAGGVSLYSGASGALLRSWSAEPGRYYFGEALALGPDADGDGGADVAIASDETSAPQVAHVVLYGGRTGATLRDWRVDNVRILAGDVAIAPDLDGDGRADVLVAGELAEEQSDLVIWTAHALSSRDGHDVATWREVETPGHRYREPVAIAAAPGPCGVLVAIAINETSPLDGPSASQVDLHALP